MSVYDYEAVEVNEIVDIPEWISSDIDTHDVAAICEGGCASGAYMPAVTYSEAAEVIAEYGDDVLEYIENTLGELPALPEGVSWGGVAVHFLSHAVELWAIGVLDECEEYVSDTDDEEE